MKQNPNVSHDEANYYSKTDVVVVAKTATSSKWLGYTHTAWVNAIPQFVVLEEEPDYLDTVSLKEKLKSRVFGKGNSPDEAVADLLYQMKEYERTSPLMCPYQNYVVYRLAFLKYVSVLASPVDSGYDDYPNFILGEMSAVFNALYPRTKRALVENTDLGSATYIIQED